MRADIERYLAGQPIVAPPLAGTAVTPAYADSGDEPTSFFGDRPDEDDEEERKKRWPLFLAGLAILAPADRRRGLRADAFSSAPEQNAVPSVIDMTRKQAEQRIEDAGPAAGDVSKEASTDYRKGLVMDQTLGPSRCSRSAPRWDITVSTGDLDVVVLSVIMNSSTPSPRSRASAWVAKPGRVQSDDERDTVTRTDPEAATSVSAGSTVRIFWSTGLWRCPAWSGPRRTRRAPGSSAPASRSPGRRGPRHRGRGRPGARAEPVGGQPSEPARP